MVVERDKLKTEVDGNDARAHSMHDYDNAMTSAIDGKHKNFLKRLHLFVSPRPPSLGRFGYLRNPHRNTLWRMQWLHVTCAK